MSLVLKHMSGDAAMALVRAEILDADISHNSVIALNGLLYDPPISVLHESLDEILDVSLNAALSRDVCTWWILHLTPGFDIRERDHCTWENYHQRVD